MSQIQAIHEHLINLDPHAQYCNYQIHFETPSQGFDMTVYLLRNDAREKEGSREKEREMMWRNTHDHDDIISDKIIRGRHTSTIDFSVQSDNPFIPFFPKRRHKNYLYTQNQNYCKYNVYKYQIFSFPDICFTAKTYIFLILEDALDITLTSDTLPNLANAQAIL